MALILTASLTGALVAGCANKNDGKNTGKKMEIRKQKLRLH